MPQILNISPADFQNSKLQVTSYTQNSYQDTNISTQSLRQVSIESSERKRSRDQEYMEPKKRARTAFTPEQIKTLEDEFNRNKYLAVGRRLELSKKLSLTETQVSCYCIILRQSFRLNRFGYDCVFLLIPSNTTILFCYYK